MSAVGEYGFPLQARGRAGRSNYPRLISDRMAYAARLREWGAAEARRLALAIVRGRSSEQDGRAELATYLAGCAERAGIVPGKVAAEDVPSCRLLAAELLGEALDSLDAEHAVVLRSMVEAAVREADREGQALAAACVAREAGVPPYMIHQAVRWARWRRRRGGGA